MANELIQRRQRAFQRQRRLRERVYGFRYGWHYRRHDNDQIFQILFILAIFALPKVLDLDLLWTLLLKIFWTLLLKIPNPIVILDIILNQIDNTFLQCILTACVLFGLVVSYLVVMIMTNDDLYTYIQDYYNYHYSTEYKGIVIELCDCCKSKVSNSADHVHIKDIKFLKFPKPILINKDNIFLQCILTACILFGLVVLYIVVMIIANYDVSTYIHIKFFDEAGAFINYILLGSLEVFWQVLNSVFSYATYICSWFLRSILYFSTLLVARVVALFPGGIPGIAFVITIAFLHRRSQAYNRCMKDQQLKLEDIKLKLDGIKLKLQEEKDQNLKLKDQKLKLEDINSKLQEETKKLNQERDERLCVICQVQIKSIVLLPCQHMCLCKQCLDREKSKKCPMCRHHVESTMEVFV